MGSDIEDLLEPGRPRTELIRGSTSNEEREGRITNRRDTYQILHQIKPTISWENAKEHDTCGIDVERLDSRRVKMDSEDAGIGLFTRPPSQVPLTGSALIMYLPING